MAKHALESGEEGEAGSRQKIDTSEHIEIRALITNRQTGLLIGDDGSTLTSIKSVSSAELDVSDLIRGAIERVLTISGPVQDVSKSFVAAIEAMQGTNPSTVKAEDDKDSFDFSLKLAVPHIYMSTIIGSTGTKLHQLMTSTQTKIKASEFLLPLSSDRAVVITGAPQSIGSVLIELGNEMIGLKERAETSVMNRYTPISMFGRYGHPESFRNPRGNDTMITPSNPYGIPPSSFMAPTNDTTYSSSVPDAAAQAGATAGAARVTKDKVVQQIYIPNDMVGAIIGKSGSKINEIRNLSGSHIKINEPDPTRPNERLITVEGTGEQNQLALYMLYQRLESEKRRV